MTPPDEDPTIAVIEDDASIRRFLRISLEAHGYRVHESRTGEAGLALCAQLRPDLVILDLGLPDMDGQTVIQRLRDWTGVPIVILSVRSDERQKVAALDAGANDYVTKPFGISEFLARVRVLLRQRDRENDESFVFAEGDLKVDLHEHRLWVDGEEVRLTNKEFSLLSLFVKRRGHVLTHGQILDAVWGEERGAETQNLRVLVAALRQKLGDDPAQPRYIITEPGVGYRFC
jgi:two-component system KDP operon response regulator KdpE